MAQDLYYLDPSYFAGKYFVYTADAEARLNSVSRVTCVATDIKPDSVHLTSQFTLATKGSRTVFISSLEHSQFTLSATAMKVKVDSANLSSTSTMKGLADVSHTSSRVTVKIKGVV